MTNSELRPGDLIEWLDPVCGPQFDKVMSLRFNPKTQQERINIELGSIPTALVTRIVTKAH